LGHERTGMVEICAYGNLNMTDADALRHIWTPPFLQ
jgi:hypothetical protein